MERDREGMGDRAGIPALETVCTVLAAKGLVAELNRDDAGLTLATPTTHGLDFHHQLTANEPPWP